jgi:hypothetical protein
MGKKKTLSLAQIKALKKGSFIRYESEDGDEFIIEILSAPINYQDKEAYVPADEWRIYNIKGENDLVTELPFLLYSKEETIAAPIELVTKEQMTAYLL